MTSDVGPPKIHRFTVGDLSCAVISDGQPEPPLAPALSDFFTPETGVPAPELRAAAERAGRTTLTCGYNCLCVRTPDGLAVIDTGLGKGFLGYGPHITPLVGGFCAGLAASGLGEPAALVLTHLHEDHVRGAIWPGEPVFPEARAFAHAAEIAFWSRDDRLPREQREPARRAIGLLGERLRPVEYDVELLPGVRTVDAAGHTPGHTAILLGSRGERLLCLGDTFYDPLQLAHPDWRTPWDHDARRSVAGRRRLLAWAAEENVPVHAYHLPFPGLGLVSRRGDAFAWRPL
ncbi:MBL fold metallo-hydrolase [Nonomuraea sp. NN258]|uniref:MBL fold metallo-hydrolase n=1 Tax=Nonomuraea antri TaxID=2730852 RepID=UPI00156964CE|nr:MBL fold metallo-hydrolase [Nonomuraea antri]NRQ34624.1 MBL fold metallo-hydrolase [Nonomuraea antri]